MSDCKEKSEAKGVGAKDVDVQMVNSPIYNGSTVLFDSYADLKAIEEGRYQGILYGTDRLPNQREFESAICELEGGSLTRAFPSGISAIINCLLALTQSGDRVLVVENVYGPTAHFCQKILSKFHVHFTPIPADVGEDIERYITPDTAVIFLESPGSNTFELQDLQKVTSIAKEKGIATVFDNTWATPLYCNPFKFGVDVVIQSVTKYISGHSDVLLGTVTANEKYAEKIRDFYLVMELFASPRDCYLAMRGLHTLKVRLNHHEKSALGIAEWLEQHELVKRVIHPALKSHPQHEVWKEYFTGSSGLFGFVFKDKWAEDKLAAFIDSLEQFGIGFSWGGFKSLVTVGRYSRPLSRTNDSETIIRINVGLEETELLRNDIERAMSALK